MRNPLINLDSNHDADLRALEPVPEVYSGNNNPYRGIEQHGIDAGTEPSPTQGYGDTIAVELAPEEPLQDPVPVIVVNESAREQKDWSVQNWPIDNVDPRPVMIAGLDVRRVSLKLRNTGTNSAYLNKNAEGASPAWGWELKANETIDLDAQTPVWANVDVSTANSAMVQTLAIYSETLPNR